MAYAYIQLDRGGADGAQPAKADLYRRSEQLPINISTPMHLTSTPACAVLQPTSHTTIYWEIVLWLMALLTGTKQHLFATYSEEMTYDITVHTTAWTPVSTWRHWAWKYMPRNQRTTTTTTPPYASEVSSLEVVAEGTYGASSSSRDSRRTRRRRRQRSRSARPRPSSAPSLTQRQTAVHRRGPRRHYYRDRLNSSDDVTGIEVISETDSQPEDTTQRIPADQGSPPRAIPRVTAGDTEDEQEPLISPEGLPDSDDDDYDPRNPQDRRARRMELLSYRHQPHPEPVESVRLGASWKRVGDRWRLQLPMRGVPPEYEQLVIYLEPHQVPASPASIERLAFQQHPRLRHYATRLMLVEFTSAHGGTPLVRHRATLNPWIRPGPARPVEAIASFTYGTNQAEADASAAYRKIKQNAKLTNILDNKLLRTLLNSQPKVVNRVNAVDDAATLRAILEAGARRAGITAMLNAPSLAPTPPTTDTQQEKVGDARRSSFSPPPHPDPPAPSSPPKQRWAKRNQAAEEGSRDRSGWRTIRRKVRHTPQWELVDEWTVPRSTALKLHVPGVILCEDNAEAQQWALQLKGTTAPTALISRQRLQISEDPPNQRMAFHLRRVTTTQDPDGNTQQDSTTIPVIGFAYQLGGMHSV